MQVERTVSGDLVIGLAADSRFWLVVTALLLPVVVAFSLLQAGSAGGGQGFGSWKVWAIVVAAQAALVPLALRWYRQSQFRFDSRRRVVERGGRVLCRYDHIEEVVIQISRGYENSAKFPAYAVHLVLRGRSPVKVAGGGTEDFVNDVCAKICAETGVGHRLVTDALM